jgi:hypothetical protein
VTGSCCVRECGTSNVKYERRAMTERKRELALLERLHTELLNTPVNGSHMAKVWMGTGLNIAASIVEEHRIEILCEEIVSKGKEHG